MKWSRPPADEVFEELAIIEKTKRWYDALELMQKYGDSLDVRFYNRLVTIVGIHCGKTMKAWYIWQHAKQQRVQPDAIFLNNILTCIVHSDRNIQTGRWYKNGSGTKLQLALQLLKEFEQQHGVLPSIISMNLLLQLEATSSGPVSAENLLRQLVQKYGLKPDATSYTIIIKACLAIKGGSIGILSADDVISNYIKEMQSNEIPFDTTFANVLLDAEARRDCDLDTAANNARMLLQLMSEFHVEPNTATVNTILDLLGKKRSLNAFVLIRSLFGQKAVDMGYLSPDSSQSERELFAVLNSLLSTAKGPIRHSIFTYMLLLRCIGIMMRMAAQNELSLEQLSSVLPPCEARVPADSSLTCLFNTALHYYNYLLDDELCPLDMTFLISMLETCVVFATCAQDSYGDTDAVIPTVSNVANEAIRQIEEISSVNGKKVPIRVYNKLLHLLCICEDSSVFDVFDEVAARGDPPIDTSTLNIMTHAIKKLHYGLDIGKPIQLALDLFQRFRRLVDSDTFVNLFEICGSVVRNDTEREINTKALLLLNKYWTRLTGSDKLEPTTKAFHALLDALVELYPASAFDMAHQILGKDLGTYKELKPTCYTYSILLKACLKLDLPDDAFKLYNRMLDQGLTPYESVVVSMIRIYGIKADVEGAKSFAYDMYRTYGIAPSFNVRYALFKAAQNAIYLSREQKLGLDYQYLLSFIEECIYNMIDAKRTRRSQELLGRAIRQYKILGGREEFPEYPGYEVVKSDRNIAFDKLESGDY